MIIFKRGTERQGEIPRYGSVNVPVILVANLILPRAKAAAGQDVLVLEVRQDLGQRVVALQARRGAPVVEAADVGAHDLVLGHEELRVEQAADAVVQQRLVVDGLVQRLGYLEHQRPVGPRPGRRGLGLLAVGKLLVARTTCSIGWWWGE